MKTLYYLSLTIAPVLVQAQQAIAQQANYHLTVKLPSAKAPAKAWLITGYGMTDQQVLDSANPRHAAFAFSGPAPESPEKVTIVIDAAGQGPDHLDKKAETRTVWLVKGRTLVRAADSLCHATVTGTKLNVEYAAYTDAVLSLVEKAEQSINADYAAAPEDKK